MPIKLQASDLNQDGSITVEYDGKAFNLVKESDLGAVKSALKDKDGELTRLQTELAGVNTSFNTKHQELLQLRASIEKLEKLAGEHPKLQKQLEDLSKELAGEKSSRGGVESKYTERLRKILSEGYKIDLEKIKDKGLVDLENMESTLSSVGFKPAPPNYDGKSGVTSSPDVLKGKSPLSLAMMGYESSNKK